MAARGSVGVATVFAPPSVRRTREPQALTRSDALWQGSLGGRTSEIEDHQDSDEKSGEDRGFQVRQRQPSSFC